MSSSTVVTIIIAIVVGNLGTVLAIIWYLGSRIENRIDRLENRFDHFDGIVQGLREDVAVLKATR